ncbi:MAG: class II aldolase/adducin family protein [Bacillota bacterium]|nr:class II aldolase/adducin family protein [Bacillota bacterium]
MDYRDERKQLIETAQEIYNSKLVVGTWGNVSVRIKEREQFLITPSGMDYCSLLTEDIVLMNVDGTIAEGKWKPSVEAPMHSRIYQERVDAGAIVHVHSPFASVFAVANQSIPVILEETAQIIGHEVQTAEYAACGSNKLAEGIVQTLGNGRAVLLAHHGLVGVGKDLSDALKVCYIAEKTAQVALYSKLLGGAHVLPEEDIKKLNHSFASYGQKKE